MQQVVAALRDFPGEVAVRLAITNGEGESQLVEMPPELKVEYSPLLHQRLVGLLGEAGVHMEP